MESQEPSLVAVIEDDRALREAIESLLGSAGFAATGFESAEEFLCCAGDPCCVIVDWRLPRMSGLDMLQRLRAARNPVPAIVMSARDEEARQAAHHLQDVMGAVAFLRKPFQGEVLLQLVRAVADGTWTRTVKWRRGTSSP